MTIEFWELDRIKPYERNARKIPQKAIDKVAASLKEFGWQQPIVVDKKGVIIAGHTRLLAAAQIGMIEAPVVKADKLSGAQVKAYRLADNRLHEETAWDVNLLGIELGEIGKLKFDIKTIGFDRKQLDAFMLPSATGSDNGHGLLGAFEYRVIVDCASEQHQAELLERFSGEGLKCRALIS